MIASLKTEPAGLTVSPPPVRLPERAPLDAAAARPATAPTLPVERETSPYRIVLCCSREQGED